VHACHIGMKLGLRRIIVPLGAGVASAFGFLAAPISFAFVQGWVAPLAGLDFARLSEITSTMTAQGKAMAAAAGVVPEAASARILGAMRYAGQGPSRRAMPQNCARNSKPPIWRFTAAPNPRCRWNAYPGR
jgi:N-methylhydantoinase A